MLTESGPQEGGMIAGHFQANPKRVLMKKTPMNSGRPEGLRDGILSLSLPLPGSEHVKGSHHHQLWSLRESVWQPFHPERGSQGLAPSKGLWKLLECECWANEMAQSVKHVVLRLTLGPTCWRELTSTSYLLTYTCALWRIPYPQNVIKIS